MKIGFAALATLVALFAMALPAQATVIDQAHYFSPYSDDFEVCGFSVHVEGLATGNAHARVGKGDLMTAFFGLDNYEYSETWTNTATGRSFTIWGNAVIHDVKATHVSGSIFQFTTIESGRPFNLVDASGRTLLRDRGSIRTTYLFDTEGDETPGGIFLDVITERVSGPHPAFFLTEDEFCGAVAPLLA